MADGTCGFDCLSCERPDKEVWCLPEIRRALEHGRVMLRVLKKRRERGAKNDAEIQRIADGVRQCEGTICLLRM